MYAYRRTLIQPCMNGQKDGQTSFPRHDMPTPLIKIYGEEEGVEVKIGVEGVEVETEVGVALP